MSPESERPNRGSAQELYADFIARNERGEAIEWESFLKSHPEFRAQLRALHEADEPTTTGEVEWEETFLVETGTSDSHSASDEQIVLVTHSDRYLPDGHLGQGGMGVVNKVWDKNLKRSLAMKVIRQRDLQPNTGLSTVSRDELRFLDEAQIAARLEHPGVAPVHEIGRDEEGQLYFTMRLVVGESLDAIFKKVWDGAENWTQTRAIQILIRVCETIAFAHSRGIIHRDLKLENVMVGQFGETYVMDWGLAKQLHSKQQEEVSGGTVNENWADSLSNHQETQAGAIIGTPRFMAPEQAAGDVANSDERTDVYAIGAMLYVLLARQLPYAEVPATSLMEIIKAVLAGPPAAISTCNAKAPAELIAICEQAMARRKEDRYENASSLSDDLQAYLDNRVVRAYQTGALAEARKWFARNRRFAAASLAAVFAIIAGLGAVVGVQRIKNAQLQVANASKQAAFQKEQAARREADENAKRSQGLYLASRASAVLDEDPGLSLVLAVKAAEQYQGELANTALFSALHSNRERLTLTTARGEAFSGACYSPDGKLILTTSDDGLARLWNAGSGRLIRVLAGHGKRVNEAEFSDDGQRIVTASWDGTAIIWDAETGKPKVVLRGHTSAVRKAIFNSKSTKVLTAAYDKSAAVWDAATGRLLQKLEGHQDIVTRAVFSHDGRTVATGSADKTVGVWDAETGKLRFPPLQHGGAISSLDFSPDDRYLLTTGGGYPDAPSDDRLARLWDAQTGELLRSFEESQSAVSMAVYGRDAKWIVTSSQDGKVRIYNASTGDLQPELDHEAPVYYLACDQDGKYLAATTSQNDVRVWRISDGSLLSVLRGHEDVIRSLEFSRNGERLLTASEDGTAREWMVASHGVVPVIGKNGQTQARLSPDASRIATWVFRTPAAELREFPSADTVAEIRPGGDITSVAFASDVTKFAVATTKKLLAIYDAADGKLLRNIDVPYDFFHFGFDADGTHVIVMGNADEPVLRFRVQNGEQLNSISTGGHSLRVLSPAGDRLFAYSRTRPGGQLWNLQTGQLITELTEGPGLGALFDPTGRKLLVWSSRSPIVPRVYETETGMVDGQLFDQPQRVMNAYFVNNGDQVVTISDGNHIELFDGRTLARLKDVETTSRTPSIRVNHELTRLLSRSDNKTVRLWDLDSGKQKALLVENAFGFGEFSPDGNRLVTYDNVSHLVVLRRALDGATLVQYTGPSPADAATFDPSGQWIIATFNNGEVHIWPVDPLELGRRSVPRKLTPNERERLDVGDRLQWPKYRRDWTAELIRDDLAALSPALEGGGTRQQRAVAVRLLQRLSQLIADEISAEEDHAAVSPNVRAMIDAALEQGRALLASAGRDDPRLLIAVAELHFLRKDFQSAILLAEEAVRLPASTSEQAARLQTYREALP